MFDRAFLFFSVLFFSGFCVIQAAADETQPAALKRSWVNLEKYSGRPGSAPVTQADFRQLAFELQAQRSTRAAKSLSMQQRQPYERIKAPRNNLGNRVPLSVIHWDRTVATVTPAQQREALATGVAPETASTNLPVFAFVPVRPTTYRGADLTLTLDAADFFEETAETQKAIVALRADAGDGNGWQALNTEQEVTASYADTGTKNIALEATLADGSVLRASASLKVAALTTPDPTETVALNGGQLYIYKSDDHAGLRCPVFVVEGFDMNNDMDWDALYNILNEEQLEETLRSYGRDLIVLDFTDAMADIFSNAGVAIDAINTINSMRSDMGDKFTVIGASMGGLVSRNALAKMDAAPTVYGASCVNTWVSFDSPHEGANIPLGIQEFFSFFGSYSDDYSDLSMALEYRKKVDSPAAQQMLMCHYKSKTDLAGPSPDYVSFASELRADGYPTSCKKIAITNGSGAGHTQPFSPGDLILSWYHNSFTVGISSKIYALNRSSTTDATVFYGWFNPLDWWNNIDDKVDKSRYYPYALDNAAGGTRSSFQQVFDELPSSMIDSGDHCYYSSHCFIPTTSALGIPKEYLEKSIAENPSVAALSPFDEFHCAAYNEPHIDINTTNKEWFVRAVLENYDSDGDGTDDYQEYVSGTDYLSTNTVEFVQTAITASGEGDSGSGTFSAVASVSGIGPNSVNVYLLPGSASASDYVATASPITLTWAEGESGTKEIRIPIKGDRTVEGEEVFYLVLGSYFSERIGKASVCTVTIPDDDVGTVRQKGVFVTGLPQSPMGGKVSGAKYCLTGKTVTLSASANAGWTFVGWEDGSLVSSRTVRYDQAFAGAQDGVMCCTAFFKKTSALALPVLSNPGSQNATVGVAFDLPLPVVSECLPTVTVKGLPAGLKWNGQTMRIVGVPTRAEVSTVTVAAANPKGAAASQIFTVTVEPLPAWAQGSFVGFVESDGLGAGSASMSITANGGVTGKLTLRGTNFSFSATSYAARDAEGAFALQATATVSRVSLPLSFSLNVPETLDTAAGVPLTLSKAEGTLGDDGRGTLYRIVWKDAGLSTVATNVTGYYTATLPGGSEYGSGYLTFTVDKSGSVKTAGKLADGTAVSLSGTLILDEAGRVFAVLYTAPAAYKGGGLFGLAELKRPEDGGPVFVRCYDGSSFLWQNLSPQCTATYGAGFAREAELSGGWYSKTDDLSAYFAGKSLTVGTDTNAILPELTVGALRYDSVCWNPSGIALTPTLKSGVLTGLAAPAAGKPTDTDKDGKWDYSATNSVGLKIGLIRATGVFKGSFLAWFDYPNKKHVSKSLSFEGVLTPVREDGAEAVAGRGFFLWADKSAVPAYTFSWSYDLKILLSDAVE